MTRTTDEQYEDLVELTAFLAEHVDRIPRHRRAQATRLLERVETLLSDPTEGDAA